MENKEYKFPFMLRTPKASIFSFLILDILEMKIQLWTLDKETFEVPFEIINAMLEQAGGGDLFYPVDYEYDRLTLGNGKFVTIYYEDGKIIFDVSVQSSKLGGACFKSYCIGSIDVDYALDKYVSDEYEGHIRTTERSDGVSKADAPIYDIVLFDYPKYDFKAYTAESSTSDFYQ